MRSYNSSKSIECLEDIHLFHSASPVIRELIRSHIRLRRFKAEDFVLRRNIIDDNAYIIYEGTVRVSRFSHQGKEVIYRYLSKNECFGLQSAFGERICQNNIITHSKCTLGIISGPDLRAVLKQCPELYIQIGMQIATQCEELNEKIFEITTMKTGDRIQIELLRMCQTFPKIRNTINIMPAPSHEQIGAKTGASREHVTRELNDLRKRGFLNTSRGKILIRDFNGLKTYIHENINS